MKFLSKRDWVLLSAVITLPLWFPVALLLNWNQDRKEKKSESTFR